MAQPHADKTRGENGKHRTGTKHSRRRTERTGRQAPLPTDRIGTRAENSKQRRRRKQRPHEDSKGEEASIVADSRGGEQKLNQLLAKTYFCE